MYITITYGIFSTLKNIYGMLYGTNNCETNIIIIYGMHTIFT